MRQLITIDLIQESASCKAHGRLKNFIANDCIWNYEATLQNNGAKNCVFLHFLELFDLATMQKKMFGKVDGSSLFIDKHRIVIIRSKDMCVKATENNGTKL